MYMDLHISQCYDISDDITIQMNILSFTVEFWDAASMQSQMKSYNISDECTVMLR